MSVIVVGNGILGLAIADALLRHPAGDGEITVVGPVGRRGAASMAAAAMLNSFAELEPGGLDREIDRTRFDLSREATRLWPDFMARVADGVGDPTLKPGMGTFVVNNAVADDLDDINYDAIVAFLTEFSEPFQHVAPRDIPNYRPAQRSRAARAIYIEREGWLNPKRFIRALEDDLARRGAAIVDAETTRLLSGSAGVAGVALADGRVLTADRYVFCPGANFSRILGASGLGLPVQPVYYGVGATIEIATPESMHTHCVRTPNRGLACGVYSAPYTAETVLIGASNFISPVPEDEGRVTSIYSLLKAAMEQLNEDFYRARLKTVNVGWRPTTLDTYPLLGATSLPNLFMAGGTKRDGLHLAPAIAGAMARLVLQGEAEPRFAPFAPEREPHRLLGREEAIEKGVRHLVSAAYQHDYVPAHSRMPEQVERMYRADLERLHDQVGAVDWGIPVELHDMYRYGHAFGPRAGTSASG